MPTLPLQHRVQLITGPSVEPISVADAKRHLRVEHSDDDLLIKRLIETAVSMVDVTGVLGKAMITQTWGEWFAPNPSQIVLSLGPVQSVSAIKYYDTDNALQTDTLSNYFVLGTSGRTTIKPKSGYNWPTTFTRDDAIKIEYVIGYGDTFRDVPSTVRHALFMLVAHYYENRENELIGTISKTLPFGFEALIDSERNTWYG
tara:strand:+ start:310 stop:912 length:603 start_codon:yes stop_codon:yes gene_type:complete